MMKRNPLEAMRQTTSLKNSIRSILKKQIPPHKRLNRVKPLIASHRLIRYKLKKKLRTSLNLWQMAISQSIMKKRKPFQLNHQQRSKNRNKKKLRLSSQLRIKNSDCSNDM